MTNRTNSSAASRRRFLKKCGQVTTAASLAPFLSAEMPFAYGSETGSPKPARAFYESLTQAQRKVICLPENSKLRSRISANWSVTKPIIGDDFYTAKQRQLIHEILKHITSEEGYERLIRQMEDDDGGIEFYTVGFFGTPGTPGWQWMLAGRHVTLRADPNHNDNLAFGGSLVYGHGEESRPENNLYYSHTKAVNEVFQALDAKQAKDALLKNAPEQTKIKVQGAEGKFPGVAVSDFSSDQKELLSQTMKTLLSGFREADVKESMRVIDAGGGIESLKMAFYQQGDLESDKVWDAWRIEGPSMVWNFRGFPHVHAYINIRSGNQNA